MGILTQNKKKLLLITLLAVITVILDYAIFSNQLNYGFRDVDWQVLYYFKLFGKLSIDHLLSEIKVLGVYISESYYVGFAEKWIGLNFSQLHLFTHFLKIISAISLYMLISIVFKRKLLAFITSIIYTISHTHAGVLFQLSSGGYFLTTIFMNFFFIAYYNCFTDKRRRWLVVSSILLLLTLVLKPERMYPLVFFLLIIEIFMAISRRTRKVRLAILLPLIILYPIYSVILANDAPPGFSPGQFTIGMNIKINSILNGNFQLLTDPFASLGSIFLHGDFWRFLGQLNFQSLPLYISSLIVGPIIRLGFVTFILYSFVNRKVFKPAFFIMGATFIFGLAIYAININWEHIPPSMRIHFDPNLIAIPAIFGFSIFLLTLLFLKRFLKTHDQNFIIPISGITFASLFIFMTWVSSDIQLKFMGPQRYLSIPSMGTSLFIAWLIITIFDRLRKSKAKQTAWVIFLLLGVIVFINYHVANNFFEDELRFAGVRGSDQNRMKGKFRQLVGEINTKEKSLFYFDESADNTNAYSNEGTLLAGFEYWIKFEQGDSLSDFPDPGMLRSTRQCPQRTHQSCLELLKTGLSKESGEKGFWYKDPIRENIPYFYKLNNFHAYRFVNKDIIDIREEVLRELDL